jgi:hypothetical protein
VGPWRWPFDKLSTGFSLDAGVRIKAHDHKGLESHGPGKALGGAPRMHPLPALRSRTAPSRPLPRPARATSPPLLRWAV